MQAKQWIAILAVLLSCAACGKEKDNPSGLSDSDTTEDTETHGDTDTDTDTDADADTDADTCTSEGEACLAPTDDGIDTGTDTDIDTDTDADADTGTDTDTETNIDAPLDCGLAPGGPSSGTHVLRFESSDASIRVYLERVNEGVGVGESYLYDLLRMFIETEASCIAMVDEADLEYLNSHHNWMDVANGNFEGVRYEISMMYNTGIDNLWTITLTTFDAASGDPIEASIEMMATGGPMGDYGKAWYLRVIINELMAYNGSSRRDEGGEFDPWIELFNPSSGDVDLSGYYLSSDKMNRQQWAFPAGTILPRHEYMVLTADGETGEGPLHTGFVLSPDGGTLLLSSPNGTTSGERDYGPQSLDVSMNFDYGTDGFVPAATPTPGVE